MSSEYKYAVEKLKAAIQAKRQADRNLASLEQSIALFEGSYLADTAVSGGNIIKGFENYMKAGIPASRRRAELSEEDRLFSKSSGSHQTSVELLQNEASERARLEAEHQQALTASQATNTNKDTASPGIRGNSAAAAASGSGQGHQKKRKRDREESVMSEDKPLTPVPSGGGRKRRAADND